MNAPLVFDPVFMERVWGGRRLQELFGKPLPTGAVIGESWELVDRPGEAESVIATGQYAGRTIGSLWRSGERAALFGSAASGRGERFPLLIKLLDCEQALSVQVHSARIGRAVARRRAEDRDVDHRRRRARSASAHGPA